MNLSSLVAAALPPPDADQRGGAKASKNTRPLPAAVGLQASKPVLQLSAMPTVINRAAYANAMSPGNPAGSLAALAAFRTLVDPIPGFSPLYAPGGQSTEGAWTDFCSGAAVRDGSTFAQSALANARRANAAQQISDLTPTMTPWLPVYATPADWYAIADDAFSPVSIDLNVMGQMTGPYATPGGPNLPGPPPAWTTPQGTVPLASGTRLKTLTFRALLVTLSRPWLNPALLGMGDLYLGGQPAGFYSSGDILRNDGVLPLLTTGFYLAVDVQLDADWAPADQMMLSNAAETHSPLAFEGFALSDAGGGLKVDAPSTAAITTASSSLYQIVAWTSALTPLCPQTAG